ncbi:hypothetical protein BIW11_04590 [Tropilaelaps mercedesae]|uniref:Uncharacterized protein n=1 Tax=Tropilaelaps mercedesae TaxID=418985 RepID=A0A1V9X462_9ACAR|nr:hypothetical protein BIW11_04590 [Tropilaelaps mercedesae]
MHLFIVAKRYEEAALRLGTAPPDIDIVSVPIKWRMCPKLLINWNNVQMSAQHVGQQAGV